MIGAVRNARICRDPRTLTKASNGIGLVNIASVELIRLPCISTAPVEMQPSLTFRRGSLTSDVMSC